jgi:plasmid stabilization system protein ParE
MIPFSFSQLARRDFHDSYNYISTTIDAPQAAERLMAELDDELDKILDNPLRHSFVSDPELAKLGFRCAHIKNYNLYYITDSKEGPVKFIRFLYNKRDWTNILKVNPAGE